jgi:hypothetical protein
MTLSFGKMFAEAAVPSLSRPVFRDAGCVAIGMRQLFGDTGCRNGNAVTVELAKAE